MKRERKKMKIFIEESVWTSGYYATCCGATEWGLFPEEAVAALLHIVECGATDPLIEKLLDEAEWGAI